ncbi:TPA: hypothetical protein ACTW3A_000590 [Klebsiella quasipneumoniae subsp. quasipneumoniae]|nr:hypothetical protein [Klebsiella quasipneumoniae subsp. quasipneumoniae]
MMDVLGQALTEHDYITKRMAILSCGIYCFVLAAAMQRERKPAGTGGLAHQNW